MCDDWFTSFQRTAATSVLKNLSVPRARESFTSLINSYENKGLQKLADAIRNVAMPMIMPVTGRPTEEATTFWYLTDAQVENLAEQQNVQLEQERSLLTADKKLNHTLGEQSHSTSFSSVCFYAVLLIRRHGPGLNLIDYGFSMVDSSETSFLLFFKNADCKRRRLTSLEIRAKAFLMEELASRDPSIELVGQTCQALLHPTDTNTRTLPSAVFQVGCPSDRLQDAARREQCDDLFASSDISVKSRVKHNLSIPTASVLLRELARECEERPEHFFRQCAAAIMSVVDVICNTDIQAGIKRQDDIIADRFLEHQHVDGFSTVYFCSVLLIRRHGPRLSLIDYCSSTAKSLEISYFQWLAGAECKSKRLMSLKIRTKASMANDLLSKGTTRRRRVDDPDDALRILGCT